MNRLKLLGIPSLIAVTLGCQAAEAAERVSLRYRGFSRTVAVDDLFILAESGEAPEDLASLLDAAGQEPEDLRSLLVDELTVSPVLLDKALNSSPGEWVLDGLGDAVHPPSGEASRQALRSAIVLSAADDNTITLLEVLDNYPTPEVVMEGDQIQSAYDRLSAFLAPLSIFL